MISQRVDIDRIKNIKDVEWRKWFAWYPVKKKNNQWSWLTYTYRRRQHFVIEQIAESAVPLRIEYSLQSFVYDDSGEVLADMLIGYKKPQISILLINTNTNLVSLTKTRSRHTNIQRIL
jgi:hypothetical protein